MKIVHTKLQQVIQHPVMMMMMITTTIIIMSVRGSEYSQVL
jgi:hypothetical protein